MFTGIIEDCGTISKIEKQTDDSSRVWIQSNYNDLILGESIAVDGICLTVTNFNNNEFCLDISPETMNVTNAKFFETEKPVNLERALRIGDRLGGHFVLGHVDTTAQLVTTEKNGDFFKYEFNDLYAQPLANILDLGQRGASSYEQQECTYQSMTVASRTCNKAEDSMAKRNGRIYLMPKGSVTVNGVSLTLNTIASQGFSVMLIPHTLEKTTLATLKIGNRVNIEFDYLAKILYAQSLDCRRGANAYEHSECVNNT